MSMACLAMWQAHGHGRPGAFFCDAPGGRWLPRRVNHGAPEAYRGFCLRSHRLDGIPAGTGAAEFELRAPDLG